MPKRRKGGTGDYSYEEAVEDTRGTTGNPNRVSPKKGGGSIVDVVKYVLEGRKQAGMRKKTKKLQTKNKGIRRALSITNPRMAHHKPKPIKRRGR